MRLMNYLRGYRVTLRSPLAAEEVAKRIRNETRFFPLPFWTGVSGIVAFGRFRLHALDLGFQYHLKPFLAGRIRRESSGSIVEVHFRAPATFVPFHFIWYVALLLITFGVANMRWEPTVPIAARFLIGLLIVGFWVVPVLAHHFGTRRSDAEFEELMDFVARVAEARVEKRSRSQGQSLGPSRSGGR